MRRGSGWSPSEQKSFPMMTVALRLILAMTRLQPHEELMEADLLTEWHESLGKSMFVSHQWASKFHPDPSMEQFRVLQEALKGLLWGGLRVAIPAVLELPFGGLRPPKCPTVADFTSEPLYLWYDYFSCPQGNSLEAVAHRQLAISCIPFYVGQCAFFVILCPFMRGKDGGSLSYSSWADRGWCRFEQMATEFRESTFKSSFSIAIKSPSHVNLGDRTLGLSKAPCTGEFGHESDRAKVGKVVVQMIWNKLQHLLRAGDIKGYRFLLNTQGRYLEGVDEDPIQGLIPSFHTELDPTTDPESFIVSRFLHENLFQTIFDRDLAGWSPLCYAAMSGSVSVVSALLSSRVNPNDATTKVRIEVNLSKQLPILSIATAYHSNEVVQLLLSARAHVNASCGLGSTPLSWASPSDNGAVVGLLLRAAADPHKKNRLHTSPFRMACSFGSVEVMKEMLAHTNVSLRFCLHNALGLFNQSATTISCLIDASADVNEQLRIPVSRTAWWSLFKWLQAKHYVRQSSLTKLAYHHDRATPLIFSILAGLFDAIPILLAAGADLNIPNSRGKTAKDFLVEMDVPEAIRKLAGVSSSSSSDGQIGHGLVGIAGEVAREDEACDDTFSI